MRTVLACTLLTASTTTVAQWKYLSEQDPMHSKPTVAAVVTSSESLALPFPHQGKNFGHLHVRQHPRHGLDVLLVVDKGQLMCSQVSGCSLLVKFDDSTPLKLQGVEPSDGSSRMIFWPSSGAKRFIEQAKKAQQILVQATFFQAGSPLLTFKTPGGLQWPPPAVKK